jgi:membrane-bound lytic murein transglycosylase B
VIYYLSMKKWLFFGFIISTIFWSIPNASTAQSVQNRAQLEQELEQIYREIAEKEAELNRQRQNSATLSRDVDILRREIDQARLQIQAKNRVIASLSDEISLRNNTIQELNTRLRREQEYLEILIKRKNELENYTFAEVLLSNQNLSEFFTDVDQFTTINRALNDSFQQIRSLQEQVSEEREALEDQVNRENDVRYEIEQERRRVAEKEAEQRRLLNASRNQEKSYEQIIQDRQARAAQIRAALFQLAGGIQGGGIPFGEAYELAKIASAKTGVRPAFILAILRQESNLGKNVGTCNRPGDTRTWREIMPGPNSGSWRDDHAAFLRITAKLGMEPDGVPLSCPLASGGWGGAMGPSQFIPTTWESYEKRVAAAVGVPVANPWNPQHAIMATALYVKDLGADKQTFTAEREAACRYYSGRGCMDPRVQNLFYGNAVMNHATNIQRDIDIIDGQ